MTITLRATKGSALTHAEMDANFNHLVRQVRPVEYFGAVGVAWGATPVNNLTALQAAIDWSSAEGGQVLLGGANYGFAGTLTLRSYTNIVGVGGRIGASGLKQLDTTWPDCMVVTPVVSTSVGGASNVHLAHFMLDGGWDLRATLGVGQAWDYTVATKLQRGIFLDTHNQSAAALNRTGSNDTNHLLWDIWVRRVVGIGIFLDGRGEMEILGVWVSQCATNGLWMESPDNWTTDLTCNNTGDTGLVLSAGNQRIENVKCWYNGLCEGEELDGYGVEVADASGITNIDLTNMSIQDTWGAGMSLHGQLLYVQGRIDNAAGGRVESGGQGWAWARTVPKTAINFGNVKNARGVVMVKGTISDYPSGVFPHLYSFRHSGADMNNFTVGYYKHTAGYLNPTLIETIAGYNNAKVWNQVFDNDGGLLHGAMTAAQLADATESVNVYTNAHQKVIDSTNVREVIKSGSGATAPWYAGGVSVITPA